MSDTLKKAAEELLKVAEAIEAEAAEVTKFVCDTCNHTASLAKINAVRSHVARTAGENVTVKSITVNEKISCPACEGLMSYVATQESTPYYYDPEIKEAKKKDEDHPIPEAAETPADEAAESKEVQQKENEEGTEKHDTETGKPVQASVDYDSLERYIKG